MRINKIYYLIKIVTVITVTIFFSCNDGYNEVQKNGISENEPIGVSEEINLKYTDSGRVTANLLSAKMLDYSNRDFPFYEFTDGVILYLFDKEGKKSTVLSDYAITYGNTDLIDLQGNVKIISQSNDTLFSEQLYYDQKKEWLYTNKPVTFKTGLDIIHGNGFDSDTKFTNAEVLEVNGDITLDE